MYGYMNIFFGLARNRLVSVAFNRMKRAWLAHNVSVRFSSVQFLDRLGRQGNMTDDSARILFKSFLQEATVQSSGMGRDVHSLMLSIGEVACDMPDP